MTETTTRGYPPSSGEARLLTDAERDLFALDRPGTQAEGHPPDSHYDPETSVALWRHEDTLGYRWHVLVLDDHAGEAPTLADAVKLAARACHESTGGDPDATSAVTWWVAETTDAGTFRRALDLHAPGMVALLSAVWREFQAREITVTVTFSAPRVWLEDTVRMFGAEVQDRHSRGEPGGPDETFAQALSEAVDEACS